jgi:hypothetical protein
MELWIDLLFGNWIGILSIATVLGTLATGAFVLTLVYRKSHE